MPISRHLILLGFVFLLSSPVISQAEWKAFRSRQHKFTVDFPAEVRQSKGTSPEIDGHYYDIQSMIVPLRQSFDIRVVDDPYAHKRPTDEQLKIRLDRARDSAVSDGLENGKLIKEVELRLNGLLGRELHTENEEYLAITRVHYQHERMYIVTALMMKSKSDHETFIEHAKRFLESFQILK